MARPMGESKPEGLRVDFDRRLKLEFHGSKVASDGRGGRTIPVTVKIGYCRCRLKVICEMSAKRERWPYRKSEAHHPPLPCPIRMGNMSASRTMRDGTC